MNELNSLRRNFLRAGSLGMVGAALPAISLAAAESNSPAGQPGAFDVHQYGATGDGTITATGAFTAGAQAGAATVTATANAMTASTPVTVGSWTARPAARHSAMNPM